MEEFGDMLNQDDSSERHDAVVVGLAPDSFTYTILNQAFRILSSQDNGTAEPGRIPLLTTHRARYVRSSSGELSLGPGPFVSALEVAVGEGCKAESVGKPARAFFEVCSRDLGVVTANSDEEEATGQLKFADIAVVGDDVEADLGDGALELGLQRILGAFSRSPRIHPSSPARDILYSHTLNNPTDTLLW
jgi:ribonucleotide monophosphatase NagD (HAD superfamily)